MKIKLLPVLASILIIFSASSCKKSSNPEPASPGTEFKFVALEATDTLLKVNAVTTIKATATGAGLAYKWTCSYGTFLPIGDGSSVQWTVCHSDRFRITCEVTDNANHSESKDVYIKTQE